MRLFVPLRFTQFLGNSRAISPRIEPHLFASFARVVRMAIILVLVCVTVGFVSLPAAAVASTVPASQHHTSVGHISMQLTQVSPTYVAPGAPVKVSFTIRNGSSEPILQPRVRLYLQTIPFITRESLQQWSTMELGSRPGVFVSSSRIKQTIPVGGTYAMTIEIPEVQRKTEGAFGMTLGLDASESGEWLSQIRTFLVVHDKSKDLPVETSLLVPLVNPNPAGTAAAPVLSAPLSPPSKELVSLSEEGADALAHGNFANVLSVAQLPYVSWVLDPSLLNDTKIPDLPKVDTATTSLGANTTQTPAPVVTTATTSSPTSSAKTMPAAAANDALPANVRRELKAFNSALVTAAKGRDIYSNAYAGNSLDTLHEQASRQVVDLTQTWQKQAFADADLQYRGVLGSLASNEVGPQGFRGWQSANATAMLLPDVALPTAESLTYTPTGVGTVATGGKATPAALADSTLSKLLVDFETPDAAVSVQQRMLAELSVISGELPTQQRAVVIAAPEQWSPQAGVTRTAMAQVLSAPWVKQTSLSKVLELTGSAPRREAPRATKMNVNGYPEEITPVVSTPDPGVMGMISNRIDSLAKFGSTLSAPNNVVGYNRLAMAVSSRPTESQVFHVLESVFSTLRNSITSTSPAKINFVAESGNIPLSVSNSLSVPVKLYLKLVPSLPLLRSEKVVPVTLNPGQVMSLSIPASALSNGDTQVAVQMMDEDGNLVAEGNTFTVAVRAQWEGLVTYILAGSILSLLVFGFYQRSRQNKRKKLEST